MASLVEMDERYNAYTGKRLVAGAGASGATGNDPDDVTPAAAALGLEPPRYCEQCGRRMIVQVSPGGWWAKCSRHGVIDSSGREQR